MSSNPTKFSKRTARRIYTGFFVTIAFFTGLLLINIVRLLIDVLTWIENILH